MNTLSLFAIGIPGSQTGNSSPPMMSQSTWQSSRRILEGVWLDPCSGIGNLTWHLISIQDDPEDFLLRQMILSDKDKNSPANRKNSTKQTLFKIREIRLYRHWKANFKEFDFLSVAENGEQNLFSTSQELGLIPKHDFVIVNPPYLATEIDSRFETARSRRSLCLLS